MKSLLIAAIIGVVIFSNIGKVNAQGIKVSTYNIKNSQGVRTSYSKVYTSDRGVLRVDSYDTRGVRVQRVRIK